MKDICCNIITIGERAKHYPWRICTNCGGNVVDIPERCPYCNAKVLGLPTNMFARRRSYWIRR